MKTAITAFALSALLIAETTVAQSDHAGHRGPAAKPATLLTVFIVDTNDRILTTAADAPR